MKKILKILLIVDACVAVIFLFGGMIMEILRAIPFSKNSTFEVINKTNKTKSFINGLQAEGFLGANDFERSKLLKGETNAFVRDNIFVKFVKCKIK